MKVWFTADTHFGHENIIKYCERPFESLEQMNQILIRNWNERVKKDDIVIFLGDFCFKNTKHGKKGEGSLNKAEYYMSLLNGQKVFVKGNHDNNNFLNTKITSLVMEFAGEIFWCVHNPQDFNSSYKINLCGHVHQHWKIKKWGNTFLVNVGVDAWKFRPVNIQEILKRISKFRREEKIRNFDKEKEKEGESNGKI